MEQTQDTPKAYVVFPDAERLDIGTNKAVAVFRHKEQAEKWALRMWGQYYLIDEIQCPQCLL